MHFLEMLSAKDSACCRCSPESNRNSLPSFFERWVARDRSWLRERRKAIRGKEIIRHNVSLNVKQIAYYAFFFRNIEPMLQT